MAEPHWVCQECKAPITPQDFGAVAVYNTNIILGPVGGYPIERSPSMELARPTDGTLFRGGADDAEAIEARLDPNVDFRAYHARCDPFAALDPYQFPPPSTLQGWLAWVVHVSHKGWMGKSDVTRMIDFWWTHKGEDPPSLNSE